jgi:hypothetical protein
MLAPLIDGMVTRDVNARLTASQALQLFEELYPQIPRDQLDSRPGPSQWLDFRYDAIEVDRWQNLPEDFVRTWSRFREPKTPLWMRVLRRLCRSVWCYYTIRWLKRVSHNLSLLARAAVSGLT